jgi:hypothetical protein
MLKDFYFIQGESVDILNERLEEDRHMVTLKIGQNTLSCTRS